MKKVATILAGVVVAIVFFSQTGLSEKIASQQPPEPMAPISIATTF